MSYYFSHIYSIFPGLSNVKADISDGTEIKSFIRNIEEFENKIGQVEGVQHGQVQKHEITENW